MIGKIIFEGSLMPRPPKKRNTLYAYGEDEEFWLTTSSRKPLGTYRVRKDYQGLTYSTIFCEAT